MKHCPTCQSTYTDDSLVYCLTDGATLVDSRIPNPRATLPDEFQTALRDEHRATLKDENQQAFPYPAARPLNPPTLAVPPPANTPHGGWNSPPPQLWTPQRPQPAPALRQRNLTPWIISAVAAFLLAVVITFLAVNSSRSAASENANLSVVQGNTNNEVANHNQSAPPRNKNQNSSDLDTPPTDPDVVLSQLTALEYEWNNANIKGDKAAVRRIVADEFRGVGADGKVANKEEMLADMTPNPHIVSLTLSDLKISLVGDTVVLTGLNTAKVKGGGVYKFRFTDTFLWRDRRWQAISSQASQVK